MLHEVSFKSYNQRDDVYGWVYVPAAEPAGIVQLVHGFGEHSRRYLHMIVRFMDAGFIVAADDHVGHGKTAMENDCWGDWGDKGPHTMMEDEHLLTLKVKEMYPDLPHFMFGHSMGSFIARDYITKYGDELNGVTLCGTSGTFPGLDDGIAYLEKLIEEGKGLESDQAVGGLVMGWMFARCEEGVTLGNEWICHDPFVQKDHAEDPFDAFTKPTSNRSFLDFCRMIEQITGPEWAAKVPHELPIYNIGGDQDPVGQYGQGVYEVSNWLAAAGCDVRTQLYTGYRHEIHNYDELKEEVEDGIVDFFYEALMLNDPDLFDEEE
jgi:alpha-beta hydrolase superfamily lysophospholipase